MCAPDMPKTAFKDRDGNMKTDARLNAQSMIDGAASLKGNDIQKASKVYVLQSEMRKKQLLGEYGG